MATLDSVVSGLVAERDRSSDDELKQAITQVEESAAHLSRVRDARGVVDDRSLESSVTVPVFPKPEKPRPPKVPAKKK